MKLFPKPIQFEWNQGNINKNFRQHKITDTECEEAFFDDKRKILKDILHSGKESRYILLGKTKTERLLFTIFTVRGQKVRIISSRDINKKERKLYEERT